MWASNWHIKKKEKKKLTKHIQTKHQDSFFLSQTQTITNMTYQSPAQWSRTKEPLFMEHLLFGAFSWVVACDVAPGRCDSQHVGIILKQPSICQGYAFSLKVLSSLVPKRESKKKGEKKNRVQQRNCDGAGRTQIRRCVFRPDSLVVERCMCVCVSEPMWWTSRATLQIPRVHVLLME